MRTFFVLLSISVLTGCASARQTYTSDGKVGHSLNCSGTSTFSRSMIVQCKE
jgi:hypothetical protein